MKIIKTVRKFFRLGSSSDSCSSIESIEVRGHSMPIVYRRNGRARKYVLRIHANKTVAVTVPRGGTQKFAREFVASRKAWLEKQWRVLESRNIPPQILRPGMEILFRGQPVELRVRQTGADWQLQFGEETALLGGLEYNLRPALENRLQNLARAELAERVHQLARAHDLRIKRVSVRNQKSRWGSCSYNGTISLNWRLIQLPSEVRDYIIVHELMHLRELNHSSRFWAEVERVFPEYRAAEDWLKKNSGQVGF